MIIQVILILALVFVAIYAIAQRKRSPVVSLAMVAITALGGVLVVTPELSNDIAHLVGVGRGADLVFYAFIAIAMGAILNLHLRNRSNHETLTKLARAVSIANARRPPESV